MIIPEVISYIYIRNACALFKFNMKLSSFFNINIYKWKNII